VKGLVQTSLLPDSLDHSRIHLALWLQIQIDGVTRRQMHQEERRRDDPEDQRNGQ
jgi:hypothetical protein